MIEAHVPRSVRFFVHGVPRPQGSKTLGHAKNGKTWMRESVRGVAEWRQLIAEAAQRHAFVYPRPTTVRLELTFTFARPSSHRKRNPPRHYTAPDCSKLARAVEDALAGIFYENDSQIDELIVNKRYGAPGDPLGCEVVVEAQT